MLCIVFVGVSADRLVIGHLDGIVKFIFGFDCLRSPIELCAVSGIEQAGDADCDILAGLIALTCIGSHPSLGRNDLLVCGTKFTIGVVRAFDLAISLILGIEDVGHVNILVVKLTASLLAAKGAVAAAAAGSRRSFAVVALTVRRAAVLADFDILAGELSFGDVGFNGLAVFVLLIIGFVELALFESGVNIFVIHRFDEGVASEAVVCRASLVLSGIRYEILRVSGGKLRVFLGIFYGIVVAFLHEHACKCFKACILAVESRIFVADEDRGLAVHLNGVLVVAESGDIAVSRFTAFNAVSLFFAGRGAGGGVVRPLDLGTVFVDIVVSKGSDIVRGGAFGIDRDFCVAVVAVCADVSVLVAVDVREVILRQAVEPIFGLISGLVELMAGSLDGHGLVLAAAVAFTGKDTVGGAHRFRGDGPAVGLSFFDAIIGKLLAGAGRDGELLRRIDAPELFLVGIGIFDPIMTKLRVIGGILRIGIAVAAEFALIDFKAGLGAGGGVGFILYDLIVMGTDRGIGGRVGPNLAALSATILNIAAGDAVSLDDEIRVLLIILMLAGSTDGLLIDDTAVFALKSLATILGAGRSDILIGLLHELMSFGRDLIVLLGLAADRALIEGIAFHGAGRSHGLALFDPSMAGRLDGFGADLTAGTFESFEALRGAGRLDRDGAFAPIMGMLFLTGRKQEGGGTEEEQRDQRYEELQELTG